MGNFIVGDWGDSFVYSRPVTEVIGQYMWISFGISVVSLIFQFIIAIPLGVTAATHQYGVIDYTVTVLVIIGISLPAFFFGKFLLTIFGKGYGGLEIFPSSGLTDPNLTLTGFAKFGDLLYHLVLPMFVLTILSVGSLMRYTRTNMLEVLNSDYIRTARAKGLSEKKVIYKHAFRNTMIPLVTMLAGTLPGLFGGAMITEQVFNIPGIGNKAYRAMIDGDIPFTMSYNMFISIMTVVGVLLSDLAYGLVDPRVKIGK